MIRSCYASLFSQLIQEGDITRVQAWITLKRPKLPMDSQVPLLTRLTPPREKLYCSSCRFKVRLVLHGEGCWCKAYQRYQIVRRTMRTLPDGVGCREEKIPSSHYGHITIFEGSKDCKAQSEITGVQKLISSMLIP